MSDDDDDELLRTPAGRLALVLKEIKRQAGRSVRNKRMQNKEILMALLGIDEKDSAGYFAGVAEIMSMPAEIRKDVASLERPAAPRALLLKEIYRVELALPRLGSPNGDAQQLWDSLGDDVIVSLEFTSHILAQGQRNKAIAQATLSRIRTMATDIIDQIGDDQSLPVRFREDVYRHAQSIVDAINLFKVHGPEALQDRADAMVGVVVRHVTGANAANVPGDHPILRKLAALTGAVVMATGFYVAPQQIAAATGAYLQVFELPSTVNAPAPEVVDPDEMV